MIILMKKWMEWCLHLCQIGFFHNLYCAQCFEQFMIWYTKMTHFVWFFGEVKQSDIKILRCIWNEFFVHKLTEKFSFISYIMIFIVEYFFPQFDWSEQKLLQKAIRKLQIIFFAYLWHYHPTINKKFKNTKF